MKDKKQIIGDNRKRYFIDKWGEGYFDINDQGHLCVCPEPEKGSAGPIIDMMEVIEDIKGEGLGFPVVIRFHDILRDKVEELNETFLDVISESGYKGRYQTVYPIKVNQMREVVEEVLDSGQKFHIGLEAGSKGELMVVLAMNRDPYALTILNGYKDYEFLKLAMIGRKLKRKVIVVMERYSELLTTIQLAKEMEVSPLIGFRIRLTINGSGKWSECSGMGSKFGLTTTEILQAIKLLEGEGFGDSLKLIHFHLGSQVTNIQNIKNAITEATRFYTELYKMGVPLEYLDIGGGLGVDYDGSCTTKASSKNYNLRSYASDIVYTVKQICDIEEVPHPVLVSESGRFISAHHSCIITKVIGEVAPNPLASHPYSIGECHHLVQNMKEILDEISVHNLQESYNDSLFGKSEIDSAFRLGVISIEEKGIADQVFQEILLEIKKHIIKEGKTHEFVKAIRESSSQYICNFSIFQSLPDVWAIKQMIPIVPLSRLDETPGKDCTLVDITCDSDGKIDFFITGREEEKRTIKLHKLNEDDYYVGFFLTGAYQDVMGDMHNLFGRLNEVHVYLDDDDPNDFYIEEVVRGQSAKAVLDSMQYSAEQLSSLLKKSIDEMVQERHILPREGVKLSDFYERCLHTSYTYLQ
ncbi:MAG: biosynthetic arginine decarboxylase [Bacteriovoracales bacterium]|nr:biosynthetic arginine decarboxylase [Bacteriovoracales bacterium]